MNIGILTFYRVANFGANLQALSTYCYLTKRGHNVRFINYASAQTRKELADMSRQTQAGEHLHFVDTYLPQTAYCSEPDEVNAMIKEHDIDALIVGSDAVAQHHPLLSRVYASRRTVVRVLHVAPERLFPNSFWGCGIDSNVPRVMMSVSCQNSQYKLFTRRLRREMAEALSTFSYLSARDEWTKEMMRSVSPQLDISVTPDPVFAFNQNAGHLVPTAETIVSKYNIADRYVLVSLAGQSLSKEVLAELKERFSAVGLECVALPMPTGMMFSHPFDHEIATPLSPIDWYALIRYSAGYIGTNMHPIVVSLHNGVPCYSIDHWGRRDFWGHTHEDGSSKVAHIMEVFGVANNRKAIVKNVCSATADEMTDAILNFNKEHVRQRAKDYYMAYERMMTDILDKLQEAIP